MQTAPQKNFARERFDTPHTSHTLQPYIERLQSLYRRGESVRSVRHGPRRCGREVEVFPYYHSNRPPGGNLRTCLAPFARIRGELKFSAGFGKKDRLSTGNVCFPGDPRPIVEQR